MVLGDSEQRLDRVVYQIVGESQGVLNTVIEGEDRRTDRGHVVGWNLRMIDQASFCWQRWDWPREACTQPVISCERSPSHE